MSGGDRSDKHHKDDYSGMYLQAIFSTGYHGFYVPYTRVFFHAAEVRLIQCPETNPPEVLLYRSCRIQEG
ncbi:hypothetical protein BH006_06780 [Salmonella enterica]|uniref:Uncharacterized protein n=1 Tax=Salmonella enterica TaxID=28901 RepID=A0A3F3IH92_SALER|nr:hypothetical protein BH006_06780 [Salmonella enterica]